MMNAGVLRFSRLFRVRNILTDLDQCTQALLWADWRSMRPVWKDKGAQWPSVND